MRRLWGIVKTAMPLAMAVILVMVPAWGFAGASKSPFLSPAESKAPSFGVATLPAEYCKAMNGVSWKKGCPVSLQNLRLVKVGYIGFNGKSMQGELVVHKAVAEDVSEIFKELYAAGYPVKSVRLVDFYDGDDTHSMEADNSSAFNYRKVDGSASLSKHSYGIAVDINPVENPYIKGKLVSPAAGKEFTDRSKSLPGMIMAGDPCYKAFTSRGWIWGGDWKTLKDYQHFEKPLKTSSLK